MSRIGQKMSSIDEIKDIGFFVKFVKEEFLEGLLEGNIYMSNLGRYIEMEKKTKVKGQGDKYEGAHVFKVLNLQIIDPETNMVLGTAKAGDFMERHSGTEKIPVFCFTRFSADDFVVEEETDDYIRVQLDIPQKEKEVFIKEFGDKAVVLPANFPDILSENADKQEYKWAKGKVKYLSYEGMNEERRQKFDDGDIEILFWKEDFFKSQREFRFVITSELVEDHLDFKVDSIKEDSMVFDTKQFLDGFCLQFQFQKE
ncbi:hypothetical protein [Priestia aryabhattai]